MNNEKDLDAIEAAKPWYKQPWLWFILTPLIAVFIYGTSFLYLSIVTMDGVVKEDYFRKVRSYEINDAPNQRALALQMRADLKLDSTTGDIQMQLKGNLDTLPKELTLDIVHPTHQQYDQSITLRALGSAGIYSGSLQNTLKGKRYLYLAPAAEDWSLRAEVLPPYEQKLVKMAPQEQ
ncbi:FixH family protein [Neptunomonas sp. XY-337]|uniref:FixH family protein n=1 Tax=Neptunomonas sp. XY-337 TaxID=2561897 RepID=UPI0010AA780D|nr:FixH family protein [Neptunomonas sp. XY-337]